MASVAQKGTRKVTPNPLWRALASPIRRRMLDRLRRGPRTTGQLVRAFPRLSRFAVMQHLGVLTDAKLVLAERRGRSRWNYLNAAPLHAMYRRWVDRFADQLADSAASLRHLAEQPERKALMPASGRNVAFKALDLKFQYTIRAAPPRVWKIIATQASTWWKRADFHSRPDAIAFRVELVAGGRMWEEFPGGGSLLWWTINEIEPEKVLGFTGLLTSGTGGPTHERMRLAIEPADSGCTVTLSHTLFGIIDDIDATTETFSSGWNQLFEKGLQPLAEERD